MSTRTRQRSDDRRDSLDLARSLGALDPKLMRPRVRAGTVYRADLVEQLRKNRSASVFVVSAPPGYGKTTLVTQWLSRDRRRHVWLTLDRADNDPATLFTYLAYIALGLDGVEPLPLAALESVSAEGKNFVERATAMLAAAVASTSVPSLIVLNQVHVIRDRACLRAIERLADALPEGSALVLSGRNVEVPLARLRANGRVVDVGIEDLAMDEPAARTLLENAGVRVRRQEVAELTRRTEGWPTGLYLAALVLKDAGPGPDAVSAVRGDHWLIADYLSSELMPGLSRKKSTFLMRTSVLDRLSGPLCDAVLDEPGSADTLRSLARSDSFLFPLDEHREWYRHRHLVREFLRSELNRLEPGLEAELCGRAAAWSEANGMLEAAVEYAHAAGDSEGVARLVGRAAKRTYTAGHAATLSRWFDWLEEDGSFERHPSLAVQGAAIHALLGEAAEAERWAEVAEGGCPNQEDESGDSPFEAWLALLRAVLCRDGVVRMKEDAEAAARLLAVTSPWRASAVLLSGVASILAGEPEEADARLADAAELGEHSGAKAPAMAALAERALLAMGVSDWPAARRLIDRARAISQTARVDSYTTTALMFAASARLALHEGAKEEARAEVAKALRLQTRLTYAFPHFAVQTFLELAGVFVSLGDAAAAGTLLREASQIMRRRPELGVLPGFAEEIRKRLQSMRSETPGVAALTSAEWRVLPLLSTHLSFREIGERLHVSPHTVKSQAMSLYRKLGVSSRSEAIQRAHELSLLEV